MLGSTIVLSKEDWLQVDWGHTGQVRDAAVIFLSATAEPIGPRSLCNQGVSRQVVVGNSVRLRGYGGPWGPDPVGATCYEKSQESIKGSQEFI